MQPVTVWDLNFYCHKNFFQTLKDKIIKMCMPVFLMPERKALPKPPKSQNTFLFFFFLSSDTTGWVRKREVDDS